MTPRLSSRTNMRDPVVKSLNAKTNKDSLYSELTKGGRNCGPNHLNVKRDGSRPNVVSKVILTSKIVRFTLMKPMLDSEEF
jgi:hypothetical protein